MLESAIGITCVARTFQEDRFGSDLRAFSGKKLALAQAGACPREGASAQGRAGRLGAGAPGRPGAEARAGASASSAEASLASCSIVRNLPTLRLRWSYLSAQQRPRPASAPPAWRFPSR